MSTKMTEAGWSDHLASLSSSGHLAQMFDSTVAHAMSRPPRPKGVDRSGARSLAWRLLNQTT